MFNRCVAISQNELSFGPVQLLKTFNMKKYVRDKGTNLNAFVK